MCASDVTIGFCLYRPAWNYTIGAHVNSTNVTVLRMNREMGSLQ